MSPIFMPTDPLAALDVAFRGFPPRTRLALQRSPDERRKTAEVAHRELEPAANSLRREDAGIMRVQIAPHGRLRRSAALRRAECDPRRPGDQARHGLPAPRRGHRGRSQADRRPPISARISRPPSAKVGCSIAKPPASRWRLRRVHLAGLLEAKASLSGDVDGHPLQGRPMSPGGRTADGLWTISLSASPQPIWTARRDDRLGSTGPRNAELRRDESR